MAKKTFYVTTPIYYPNDIPHIGHAYTTIAADVLSRWNSLLGKEVFFLTGTDENAKKVFQAAQKAGVPTKEFVDKLSLDFKNAWKSLNINYSRFIRTTDPDHIKELEIILEKTYKKGDIYKGFYEGYYCTGCEAYYTQKDLIEGNCPIHKTKAELIKEESYFFKLSKYKDKLLQLYKKNPDFIKPVSKRNEIISRINEDLRDLSISRKDYGWGIKLPFDKTHCAYVWYDALTNYYTATRTDKKEKFWPADLHIIGKDILWFHAVIWPAMLLSLGIKQPKKIFAHGWWTFNKEKISKSRGKVINVSDLISIAGVDSARYFLFRETPFGEDGDFSETALIDRHNNELANKLGNLVSRVSTLAQTYGLKKSKLITLKSDKTIKEYRQFMENLEFDKALNIVFAFIDKTNEFIQDKKPWETHDSAVLYEAANAIKDSAILLSPFIPQTAEKIASTFNFQLTLKELKSPLKVSQIKKSAVLFRKIDKPAVPKIKMVETSVALVPYADFAKLDLRVAKILSVEDIPNKDKLYKLHISLGNEQRTIVAGIKLHYAKDKLKNKKIIIISNLEPAKIAGIESKGMLLAASTSDKSKLALLTPDIDLEEGSKIS